MASCLLYRTPIPSEKRSTLKGKNLLPGGSKFFPFRVDPFLIRETITILTIASLESVPILLNELLLGPLHEKMYLSRHMWVSKTHAVWSFYPFKHSL